MSSDKATISLAQVCEMQSGEWINDPFMAVVGKINKRESKKTGRSFWVCELNDTTGSASVEMSVFTAPKFREGDQIEVGGQGNKFEDGQYGKKVSMGKSGEIHILGASVYHQEQVERKAESKPALNGELFPVNGQTVGSSMKLAMDVLTSGLTHDEKIERITSPVFWASMHEVASDVIRVARLLEAGRLAPSVRERTGETAQQVAPPARPVTQPPAARSVQPPPVARPMATPNRHVNQPTEEEMANQTGGDTTVPF